MHRDLKTENLFLTRDGRVKILDFGIAKLTSPENVDPAAGTVSMLTDVGVAVGTLGYMSPEQLRGERTDHRADLFALGAILHEMIAGAPPFRHDSRVQTVNAVLESDAPELADDVPPGIRRTVSRLLEKSPDARFRSARDLAFALSALSDTKIAAAARESRAPRRFTKWMPAAVLSLAAAAISAGLVAAMMWRLGDAPAAAPSIKRFSVEPPIPAGDNTALALSPNGSRLVFSGLFGSNLQLYQRRFDELESKPMEGTEGARMPFFSPDGNWVASESQQKLKKVPVDGGAPVTICDVRVVLQGNWGADGTIVVPEREGGLKAVSAEGGTLRPVTTPDTANGVIDHHAPFVLPGGALLYND